MPYEVTRSDTGQFVVRDPATDTVVTDNDLRVAFDGLEAALAEEGEKKAAEAAASAFTFAGGPRYLLPLLLIGLPLLLVGILYYSMSFLMGDYDLNKRELEAAQDRIGELEERVEGLELETKVKPKGNKSKPTRVEKKAPPKAAVAATGKPDQAEAPTGQPN